MDNTNEFLSLRKAYIERTFQNLNPMQQQAVYTVKGPLLILAGAGSGKTTVLVNRIANLIQFGNAYHSGFLEYDPSDEDLAILKKGVANPETDLRPIAPLLRVDNVRPWNILAITFTNKAASELKERIETRLPNLGKDVNASTFHSACMRILRVNADRIGFTNNFTIYDTDDQKRVLKDIYKENSVDDKVFPLNSMIGSISRLKDQLITAEEYSSRPELDYKKKVIAAVYTAYQRMLKAANAMDFDDLIFHTVTLFQENPDVLEKYQDRFQYILVDEYQDTNHMQYMLVSLLAQKHQNLCVVGDDDQSIYKFRGATIENILSFEEQFKGAKVIKLEQNYRSTQNILDGANSVIANNTTRKNKALWTDNNQGEKIVVHKSDNEFEEAKFVTETIQENVQAGKQYMDHAVLYRMNAQSNTIEQYFAKSGIPYRVYGGLRFFDRKEIKDVLAYLSVVNNVSDNLRLKRIINEPKRGIGAATIAKAEDIANGLGLSLFEVLEHADEYANLGRKSTDLMKFTAMIRNFSDTADETDLVVLVEEVLEQTGYMAFLKNQGPEGQTRVENVQEFVSTILNFQKQNEGGTLGDFLEEISLITTLDDYDESDDHVVLMTMHSAKGLEFENVFIVGVEEGVFPSRNAMFDSAEIEEERRLAYVGITRAKKKLYLTSTVSRTIFGQTQRNMKSRFIEEIDPNFIEEVDDSTMGKMMQGGTSLSSSAGGGFGQSGVKPNNFGGSGIGATGKKPKANNTGKTYSPGQAVEHKVFGNGRIVKAIPMGNDTLLEIQFQKVGVKKIMANFANLKLTEESAV